MSILINKNTPLIVQGITSNEGLFHTTQMVSYANIGSEEMVTILELTKKRIKLSEQQLVIKPTKGPTGVRGRNSDNRLIVDKLNWKPTMMLEDRLKITYKWIKNEIENKVTR